MIELSRKHTVEWGECDPAKIVFYPNIYTWFDKSTHDMLKAHGFGQCEMIEQFGIVGFPLIETHSEYLHPMQWEQTVSIISRVESCSQKTFKVSHQVSHGDRLCVQGYEVRVWGIRDEHSGKLRAWSLPDEFVQSIGNQ